MPGFLTFVPFENSVTKTPIYINPAAVLYVAVAVVTTKEDLVNIWIGHGEYDYIRVNGPIEDVIEKLNGSRHGSSN